MLSGDTTPSALKFFQEWISGADAGALADEVFAHRLADAFGACAAGLAARRGGTVLPLLHAAASGHPTSSWPWDEAPGLPSPCRGGMPAAPVRTATGRNLLVASSDGPLEWLLWVEGPAGRAWSTGECAVLGLGVQLVSRAAAVDGHGPWAGWAEAARHQERLEHEACLTARLVHDFGNIFTSLLGFVELAADRLPPDAEARAYLGQACLCAQRGTQLLDQLALFARRSRLPTASASVAEAAAAEEARCRSRWGGRVALQIRVAEGLPPVAMTPNHLRLLLEHLLNNAYEALEAGGTVSLSADLHQPSAAERLGLLGTPEAASFVRIVVEDNGCGFASPGSNRPRIEPLRTTKVRHGGMGLAAVYGLVQACRGGLRIDADPRSGTTVQVYLPPGFPKTAPTEPRQRRRKKEARILVVDDDPQALRLMCTTLEQAGYAVQAASDGAQALLSYASAREPFGLVLSDVLMPGLSGPEMVRQMLGRDPHIKVLFTSGEATPEGITAVLAGYGFGLLAKPFRPDGLLRAVRGALARRPGGRAKQKPGLFKKPGFQE